MYKAAGITLLFLSTLSFAQNDTGLVSLFAQEVWISQWAVSEKVLTFYDDRYNETRVEFYEGSTSYPARRIIISYPAPFTSIRTHETYDASTFSWIPTFRRIIKRHPQADTIISQEPVTSAAAPSWLNQTRDITLYTSQKQISLRHHSIWNTSGWLPQYRYSYQYNSEGRQTLFLHETWNEAFLSWVNVERELQFFGSDTLIDSSLFEQFKNEKWNSISKRTYSYDSENRLTERIIYGAVQPSSILTPVERTTISYAAIQNSIVKTSVIQFVSGESWINSRRVIDTINAVGQVTTTVNYIWSSIDWIPNSRTVFNHDFLGNILTRTEQSWNEVAGWTNELRDRYQYIYPGVAVRQKASGSDYSLTKFSNQEIQLSIINSPYCTVELFDLRGKKIETIRVAIIKSKAIINLQEYSLPTGWLIIRIRTDDFTTVYQARLLWK